MADFIQGGIGELPDGAAGVRALGGGRFRNGPGETSAADKLPHPGR